MIPAKEQGAQPAQLGNKTECGLLGFVLNMGQSYDELRKQTPEELFHKVLACVADVYLWKHISRAGVHIQLSAQEHEHGDHTATGRFPRYVEGRFGNHSQEVRICALSLSNTATPTFRRCKFIYGKNGEIVKFTQSDLDNIIKRVIEPMACDGLRTICLAYKDYVSNPAAHQTQTGNIDWDDEASVINNLVAVAIVGIQVRHCLFLSQNHFITQDPVREEVPEAILKCQRAGITVRMVTGDNVNTARSIAMSCGIIKPNDNFLVMEGREFNERVRDTNGNVQQVSHLLQQHQHK